MSPATPIAEWPETALQLMAARRTILPKRLVAPGPDAAQLHQLFTAAATAPDHDQVQPWRFVVIPDSARANLADVFGRMVSAGAAVQNVLLMATAQGFGSALTSGKALKADSFRRAFALADGEFAPYFISIGTVSAAKPGKPRPEPSAFVSTWGA